MIYTASDAMNSKNDLDTYGRDIRVTSAFTLLKQHNLFYAH